VLLSEVEYIDVTLIVPLCEVTTDAFLDDAQQLLAFTLYLTVDTKYIFRIEM
jgi:hypothetical protein